MKSILFNLMLLSIFSVFANAQLYDEKVNILEFQLRIGAYNVAPGTYKDVKGSPYLDKNFVVGKVIFKSDTTFVLKLRYNIYNDSFEFQQDETAYTIGNTNSIREIRIADRRFVFNKNEFDKKGSYYEIHTEGKCFLLSKKKVRFDSEDPGDGIRPVKPAQFVRLNDLFYIIYNSKTIFVRNKKSLLQGFEDKAPEIKRYIKKNKLSVNKSEDLTKIVTFINSLL